MNGREAFIRLMRGNERYCVSDRCSMEVSSFLRRSLVERGQHPFAAVVSCSDSRVLPEAIFSVDIGDIFVVRVSGNAIGMNELASIEYAVGHLNVPLVFVLGHDHCDAVSAALYGGAEGFISAVTNDIRQAIGEERDPEEAARKNIRFSVEKIKVAMRKFKGEPRKVLLGGGLYHQLSGKVEVVV